MELLMLSSAGHSLAKDDLGKLVLVASMSKTVQYFDYNDCFNKDNIVFST